MSKLWSVRTWRRWGAKAVLLLAVLSVTACWAAVATHDAMLRTLAELKNEPLDRGDSLPYPMAADYEAVVGAALEAVRAVELKLREDYQINDSTWMILCEKIPWEVDDELLYMSEAVVRIVVQRLGENQTEVRVISRRTDPLAWRAKGDYSQDIFAALIEKLELRLQRPEPSPAALSALERTLGQRLFVADYEVVVSGAREAVQESGITLREDYPVDDSARVIVCEKYAQSLRVVVHKLNEEQTSVRVLSRRRDPTDPLKMEEYSQDIFAALIEKLEGQPHIFSVDYEAAVSAAREAVQEVGFEVRADYPLDDSRWVMVCAKHARFLRVIVQRLGAEETAVRVIFRRGEGVELWRMEDYSQDIFATLIEKLEGKRQRPER